MSRKNSAINFIVSVMPGAGQMYQGFSKKGTSIMFYFFLVVAFSEYFYLSFLWVFLPVVWCYAFFDSIHTNSLPEDQFALLKDHFLFVENDSEPFVFPKTGAFVTACGVFLIFVGGFALFDEALDIAGNVIGYDHYAIRIMYELMDYVPRFVVSFAVFAAGIWMIRNKKRETERERLALEEKSEEKKL